VRPSSLSIVRRTRANGNGGTSNPSTFAAFMLQTGLRMLAQPLENEPLAQALSVLEERHHPVAVLLYGSHASGLPTAASDVDLGMVVGGPTPDAFALAKTRSDLEAILGRSVDLVALDSASPILRMEVLRRHRVLCNHDPEKFETFVVRTLGEYFDLKRVREPIERALLSTGA
jgi:predicted nucleotidyltransferase